MRKETQIELRVLQEKDLELLMSWRSNPNIYKFFYKQNEPLSWNEHFKWWKSRQNREGWIISYQDEDRWRDIGTINLSKTNMEFPEIGILIGEIPLFGKGLATAAIKKLITYAKDKGYSGIIAKVMRENKGSIRLFKKLGFKEECVCEGGQIQFKLKF